MCDGKGVEEPKDDRHRAQQRVVPEPRDAFFDFTPPVDLGLELRLVSIHAEGAGAVAGVEQLLELTRPRLPVGPQLFPEDALTDRSNRFLSSVRRLAISRTLLPCR